MRGKRPGWRLALRMLLPHWIPMVAGSLFGLITAASTVGLLALSGWFLSATAFAGLSAAAAMAFNYFLPGAGLRFFAVSRTLGRYADRVISHDATFRLLESLRTWFYSRLEPLAPARLMQYRSGDLLNRIVADIDALDNLYLRVLSPTATAMLLSFFLLVFLLFFDRPAGVIAFAGLLAAGLAVPLVAGGLGARVGRRIAEQLAVFRMQIVEGVQGLSELLVFGGQGRYLEALQRRDRELLRLQLQMSVIRGLSTALITAISGTAVVLVLYRGAGLVNRGELHGADLALVALAVMASFEAVTPLPSAYQFLGRTRHAGKRLLEVVDPDPAVVYPARSAAEPRHCGVSFEQVVFGYRSGAPPVLDGIHFTVAGGERVAVLGATGAGKSTLAHLLVRFWDPHAGRIRLGGQDIRSFSEADLRGRISVVSQQAHIFNASIRDNLRIARPRADDAQLWEALAAVQLDAFVRSLPAGLDTWTGESGRLISGGQARRLSVARAFLHAAPVWVLDEPTEGLDRETERRLMNTLLTLTAGRTVLLITHRLADLDRMDRILILERGRIVEDGTHEQLLRLGGRYAGIRARLTV